MKSHQANYWNATPSRRISLAFSLAAMLFGGEAYAAGLNLPATLSIYKQEARSMQPADVTVLEWSSSDSETVHVDAKGVISGLKAGTATITAKISEEESQTMKVTVSSSYQDGQSGHYYIDGKWYTLDNTANTATVTYRGSSYSSYTNEYSGSVSVPASVSYNGEEYGVTSIGTEAFYNCSGLIFIILPNSVTSIGSSAFSSCSGLKYVTLPNSVTSINSNAFSGCSGLTTITLPNSVTSINSSAFSG